MSTRRASSENWLAFRAATKVTARSRFKSLRAIATATLAADAVAFACESKALAAALKDAARSRNFCAFASNLSNSSNGSWSSRETRALDTRVSLSESRTAPKAA